MFLRLPRAARRAVLTSVHQSNHPVSSLTGKTPRHNIYLWKLVFFSPQTIVVKRRILFFGDNAMRAKNLSAMDTFLTHNGYCRKLLVKDSTCIFRAVSEKVSSSKCQLHVYVSLLLCSVCCLPRRSRRCLVSLSYGLLCDRKTEG